jgi:GNAT superfamily N-acetyltransferase
VAADADVLSQVIADAFHDLAPSRWLIAHPAGRRAVFPAYFGLYVAHALDTGIVHTTHDRTAVALWLPVSDSGPAQPADYEQQLAAATHPWTERFLVFDAALDRHHPAGTTHHHLAILAVRPDRQAQGIGTALLRAHHLTLDGNGMPAYLEASDRRTRRLYLAHGYSDCGSLIQLPDGPCLYPMWRQVRRTDTRRLAAATPAGMTAAIGDAQQAAASRGAANGQALR